MKRAFVLVAILLLSWRAAPADDACKAGELALYANFETLSVYLPCEGDDNADARADVAFRQAGQKDWRQAQPLARIKGSRMAGSVLGLKSATSYEVRVTITDPDTDRPQTLTASTRTRDEIASTAAAETIHVSPAGDDKASGAKDAPLRTISRAAALVKAGQTILVAAGTYNESVTITAAGRADAPITLRGQKGAALVGVFEMPARKDRIWTKVQGDLYSTTVAPPTTYVAVDGQRLYYWKTLDLLKAGSEGKDGKTYSVRGGWTQDKDGTLYVRMPDGSDAQGRNVQIARHANGIVLQGARHVIVEGLDIGLFGQTGVVMRNTAGCVVRKSAIHNTRTGINLTGLACTQNVVEDCELFETSVWDWPWHLCKAHDPEGSAIFLDAGAGNVIRRNRIRGYFNGVVPSMWGRLEDERYNGDLDVHDNVLWEIGDDCLEPEGTCINQRYWNNRMRGTLVGISLAPITVGPVYFIRNSVLDHHLTAVKLSNDSSGPCFLYHNTFVTTVTKTDKYSQRGNVNGIGNSGSYHNMTYRNNIIMGTDLAYCDWLAKRPRGLDMDYDNLFTTAPDRLAMLGKRYKTLDEVRQATGMEKHGTSAAPSFVDAAKGDLQLKADSPLIDKGLRLPNINDDFTGHGPDIGAFERPPAK